MSIRDEAIARRLESDATETWEIPFSESEGGSYYRTNRGSYPYTPRRTEDVPAGALETLREICGVEDLHQVFIVPLAVRSTGARGQKVIAPNSVLALGTRAVGLWTEKPQPGVRVVIPLEELAAIEDVTILLYGRLSFCSADHRLNIRYNTVTRQGLEPALVELRRRLTGAAQQTPRDDPGSTTLPFKWDQLLHTPRVRLDMTASVTARFASVPGRSRRAAPQGQLLVLNPYELVYLCDPAGASIPYGEDSFIFPRSRVTGVRIQEGGLEVSAKGARFALTMDPALSEAAVGWFG